MHEFLAQHRREQSFSLDNDTPFSWIRCGVSICSYALLLSDVIRSGIAIHSMEQYKSIEPNSWLGFGPLNYSVAQVQLNDSIASPVKVWAYKFDTTSVTLRAVAQYFKLPSWDSCMFYQAQCKYTLLPSTVVFRMLEGLVEVVAARKSPYKEDPPNVVLRTANTYRDRLHEYILQPLFNHPKVRTVQAIYYDTRHVNSSDLQFCKGYHQVRPFACGDKWTNFRMMTSSQNVSSPRLLWNHVNTRLNSFKAMHRGMQIDMLLLEGQEDFGHAHLSFQGRQYYDITIITRVRNCSIGNAKMKKCSTIMMDDFRYEAATFTSDAIGWYTIVASLRVIGQSYAWLHVLMLFVGCYRARRAEDEFVTARQSTVVRAALRTMFTCPSQVVIYGSIFPVACYAVAHLLDCNMVYELVAQRFITVLGVFQLDVREFIRITTVCTRSVWVLSIILHAVLVIRTKCCWASSSKGIPGIPEFSVSAIAFLTIGAQFRAIVLRNTNLVFIAEVVIGSRLRFIRSSRYRNSHGFWYLFFMSDNIDCKCLLASAFIVVTISVLLWAFVRMLTVMRLVPRYQFTMWPHTLVSYAAGTLWSTNSMMVSWNGFIITPVQVESYRAVNRAFSSVVFPTLGNKFDWVHTQASLRTLTSSAFVLSDSIRSARLFKEMVLLENRSREVKATICLMNLTVMTKPTSFYKLRWCKGIEISIYRRLRSPRQLFMLPAALADSPHALHIDWDELELLFTIDSTEMDWTDILNCG